MIFFWSCEVLWQFFAHIIVKKSTYRPALMVVSGSWLELVVGHTDSCSQCAVFLVSGGSRFKISCGNE